MDSPGIRRRLPVLTYHSLDDSGSPISVSPTQFRLQMQYLWDHGWRTLTGDELLAGHARGEWQARTFVLTFDDGFKSFLVHGFPILMQLKFSAMLLVVPNWVGKKNDWLGQARWVPHLELLSWRDLCELANAGIEIGSHSANHSRLTRIARRDAENEIVGSKHDIEDHIGRGVQTFAFPYGDTSHALEEIVARNFRAGFGTRLGFVTVADRSTNFSRIEMYYLRAAHRMGGLESAGLEWEFQARRFIRALARHWKVD